MHELSLCQSVLRIIEDEAPRRGFSHVSRVCLEVGELAGVELHALRFGFEVAKRGTVAEDAVLEVIETAGEGWCADCELGVSMPARHAPCPLCGGRRVRLTGGADLRVSELEVE